MFRKTYQATHPSMIDGISNEALCDLYQVTELFVAGADEIAEGGRKVVETGGVEIGVFRSNGEYFAWRNECPHQGGPVCQGVMVRKVEERLDSERKSSGIHYAATR